MAKYISPRIPRATNYKKSSKGLWPLRKQLKTKGFIFIPMFICFILASFSCVAYVSTPHSPNYTAYVAASPGQLISQRTNTLHTSKTTASANPSRLSSVASPADNTSATASAPSLTTPAHSASATHSYLAQQTAKPMCVPATSYPQIANRIAPLSSQTGLITNIEQPVYYDISATTIPALRRIINNCSLQQPGLNSNFHASTDYRITWQYNILHSNTTCSIAAIRVGLHVSQLLPRLTTTDAAPTDVAHAWDTYSAHLRTHEDGHITRSIEYAERMTRALEAIQPMPCDALEQHANTIAQTYSTMLTAEHALYDSVTNHGATQGAIL
jgi:predicted secreted Zn-dependent protease